MESCWKIAVANSGDSRSPPRCPNPHYYALWRLAATNGERRDRSDKAEVRGSNPRSPITRRKSGASRHDDFLRLDFSTTAVSSAGKAGTRAKVYVRRYFLCGRATAGVLV